MRFPFVVVVVAAIALHAASAFAGPPVYIPPPPPKAEEPAKPEPPKLEKVRLLVMNLQASDVDKAVGNVPEQDITSFETRASCISRSPRSRR